MNCTVKGKNKLWSHNTSYCLIEVAIKAGLTLHTDFRLYVWNRQVFG